MTSATSYPIALGPTLEQEQHQDNATTKTSFVSIKYNFKPPSIGQSTSGFMHSPSKDDSHWLLEYDTPSGEGIKNRSLVHGFVGAQSEAKDVDCILIWDDAKECYILDRLASSFNFRNDRNHTILSEKARLNLSKIVMSSPVRKSTSALGLSLSGHRDKAVANSETEAVQVKKIEEDRDEDEFVRQLELDLEAFTEDEAKGKISSEEDAPLAQKKRQEQQQQQQQEQARTGLGLLDQSILREDVITPRGSPYIDRPKGSQWGAAASKSSSGQNSSSQVIANARSTPVVSPTSVTNSPRLKALDSILSTGGNTWKPPPQRNNVAIAYDEEEEEESEDEEEEDSDEDEGDDDDDDLDDYARQLERSLQN